RVKINYVFRKVKKYMKNKKTACEVGIGDGYLLRLLHKTGIEVTGLDISKYLVNELNNRFNKEGLNIKLINEDLTKAKFVKDNFDLFFCIDVLEHIPNLEKAIENIKEGLSNGGLLIGTLPFYENLSRNMVMCPECKNVFHKIGHYHSFNNINEIKQLLGNNFKIIETGEVTNFKNIFGIIVKILKKIYRLILKRNILSTVYFVAKINKDSSVARLL
ncbi:unnamed protein product, partial [marine sediment metagenome]